MIYELKIPKSGMGITEAEIQTWHKAEGETIAIGDIIVDVETAKAVEEVESPVAGVLQKILVPEEESIEVGITIALIEVDD